MVLTNVSQINRGQRIEKSIYDIQGENLSTSLLKKKFYVLSKIKDNLKIIDHKK